MSLLNPSVNLIVKCQFVIYMEHTCGSNCKHGAVVVDCFNLAC